MLFIRNRILLPILLLLSASLPLCAARKGGVEFGGFIIPRTAGNLDDGILRKILCISGSGGAAVTLLKWGRQPQEKLPVSVTVDFPVGAVESVTHGPLQFAIKDGRVDFTLQLQYGDIVTVTPKK